MRSLEVLPKASWIDVAETFSRLFPAGSLGQQMVSADELAGRKRTAAAINHALGIELVGIEGTEIYEGDQDYKKIILPPELLPQHIRTIGDLLRLRPDNAQLEALQAAYPELLRQVPIVLVRDLRPLPHLRLALDVVYDTTEDVEWPRLTPDQEEGTRSIVEAQLIHLKPQNAAILALHYGLYSGVEENTDTIPALTGYSEPVVQKKIDQSLRALRRAGADAVLVRALAPTPEHTQQREIEARRARFIQEFQLHTLMTLCTWEPRADEALLSPRLGQALNVKGRELDDETPIRALHLPATKALQADAVYADIVNATNPVELVQKTRIFNRLLMHLYHDSDLGIRRIGGVRRFANVATIQEHPEHYPYITPQAVGFILAAFDRGE